jgi:hypothetical protein
MRYVSRKSKRFLLKPEFAPPAGNQNTYHS